MDGVAAVIQVLAADPALALLVPEGQLMAGQLPVGTALPAVSVTSVSLTDRNIPAPGANRFVVERVQVLVMAADYATQRAVLRAVRHAAADRLGVEVPGLSDVKIHLQSGGAEFSNDAASLVIGSQDFRVMYTQAR